MLVWYSHTLAYNYPKSLYPEPLWYPPDVTCPAQRILLFLLVMTVSLTPLIWRKVIVNVVAERHTKHPPFYPSLSPAGIFSSTFVGNVSHPHITATEDAGTFRHWWCDGICGVTCKLALDMRELCFSFALPAFIFRPTSSLRAWALAAFSLLHQHCLRRELRSPLIQTALP